MSRSVTLQTGWARVFALLAIATLLASVATVTTAAVKPTKVLAIAACNATYNPPDATRIQVSFSNLTIGLDGSGIYLDPVSRKFYTAASSAADASLAPSFIDFVVTSGAFSGSDIWCVLVNQSPVGARAGNDLDTTTGVFYGQAALAGFAQGDEVCITAMISAAAGQGAPKNKACFVVGRHTTTTAQTASLSLAVVTSPASSGQFQVSWTCGGATNTANVAGNAAAASVTTGLTLPGSCTATPIAGPGGETWTAGVPVTITLAGGVNTITVSFTQPGAPPIDPCVANPSSCAEVLAVVTEKPATAPPTDGLAASTGSTAPALGLLLLILAAIVGGLGLMTPASKRIRR